MRMSKFSNAIANEVCSVRRLSNPRFNVIARSDTEQSGAA